MSFIFYFKDLFFALILRPVLRDPFRMIVTVTGVAIGVAVFLSIQLANKQTLRSFEESVNLVLGRADAVIHADSMAFDEKTFGIDGIGMLTFKAIGSRDYGIIMGFLVIATLIS